MASPKFWSMGGGRPDRPQLDPPLSGGNFWKDFSKFLQISRLTNHNHIRGGSLVEDGASEVIEN